MIQFIVIYYMYFGNPSGEQSEPLGFVFLSSLPASHNKTVNNVTIKAIGRTAICVGLLKGFVNDLPIFNPLNNIPKYNGCTIL